MVCPYKSPECKKGKKCADCRAMEKIIKKGKCVKCKKPTSKETLEWNGGTCEPCTEEEMGEIEAEEEEANFEEEEADLLFFAAFNNEHYEGRRDA